MKRGTSLFPTNDSHPDRVGLLAYERETRRLFAEHAHDPLTRLALAFDSQVRRLANRVAARLRASRGTASSVLR